jgi:4-amino-4-deoxy-L-arabinose transferase-like glycosyltransferase
MFRRVYGIDPNSLATANVFQNNSRREMKNILQKWGLPALTLFTFFFLLGNRSLNEPDEGRYSEIAREMIETGDWLVPHLWYLPHLDKPPMTYWLVAVSIKIFGQNEWAVRLPVALAGISGVFATFLLGCSIGGRRVGIWSALILQSSLIYFVAARMLTPDILLTQFIVWSFYFFWRSWMVINPESGIRNPEFFRWHSLGWVLVAFGFLTKGPIALAIPMVAFGTLIFCRRHNLPQKGLMPAGLVIGFILFLILSAPWFLLVFQRVPGSAHYMALGQAAGHLLGTTIKNRPGGVFYFFGILAVGFLPWTILLGWIWSGKISKSEIANRQSPIAKDGWLLLSVWVIFTFVLFSFSKSKLPDYILPIFPALAVLLALRFFQNEKPIEAAPAFVWRIALAGSMLLPAIFPLLLTAVFHDDLPKWLKWQPEIVAVEILVVLSVFWPKNKWPLRTYAASIVAFSLIGLFIVVAEIPQFETRFRGNQTLKPLGIALREKVQPGDAVVCWGKFPQGLPFYSVPALSATYRPYLGGMDLTQVPFEFPGNRERLGNLLLDDAALSQLLDSGRKVWIVAFGNSMEKFQKNYPATPLHSVTRVGQWELLVNH